MHTSYLDLLLYIFVFLDAPCSRALKWPIVGANACIHLSAVSKMSRDTIFLTMWYVRPAKAPTSLRIRVD